MLDGSMSAIVPTVVLMILPSCPIVENDMDGVGIRDDFDAKKKE